MPPTRTEPVSTGWNGSLTSNCLSSPVPQQETYSFWSSTARARSVISGGTAPNGCSAGGRTDASAGSAGIEMTFCAVHAPSSPSMPQPDRGGQVLDADHHADEAVLLGRVVGRAQLQRHLVLVTQVNGLHVGPGLHVPEVQPVPVLAAEQQVGDDAVLDHRRGAPLGGDRHVVVDVPPHVIGQVLVAAVGLPLAGHVKGVVVQQRDAAGALLAAAAQAGHEQPAGTAVHGVRPGVVRPLAQFLGPEHLGDHRAGRVGLGVHDIQPGGPQARHDQVPAVAVVMAAARAQGAGARVPAEVVQLVAEVGQLGEADHGAVGRGVRINIHHGHRVGLVGRPGKRGDVGQLLRGRGGRVARRAVEGRIVMPVMRVVVLLLSSPAPLTS